MAEAPNLLPLKILVISLGVILVGGTFFVLTTLVDKANKMQHSAQCNDATISLTSLHAKGQLTNILPQGNVIQLMFSEPDKQQVMTLDRCSGTLLQTVTVTP